MKRRPEPLHSPYYLAYELAGFAAIELVLLTFLLASPQAWTQALAALAMVFVAVFGWLQHRLYACQLVQAHKATQLLREAVGSVVRALPFTTKTTGWCSATKPTCSFTSTAAT